MQNHPSVQEGAPLLKPQLPRDAGKPCLVLDMDETLLCAQEAEEDPEQVRNFKINHSFVVDIMVPYSEGYGAETFMVSKRPGCDELLRTLSQHYELVLFTHSKQAYADALMNLIDPEGLISSRLYRPAVSVTNSGYFKDLTLLGRPMEKVVLVDDNPGCTDQFPENSISCYGYGGLRRDDPELFRITRFLSLPEVYGAPDIRVALKLYTARQHKYKEEEIKKWQAKQAEEKKKEEERKAALKRAA